MNHKESCLSFITGHRYQKPWYFTAKSLVSVYHDLGAPSTLACLLSLWLHLGFSTKGLSYHIWYFLAKSLVSNPPICQNFPTVYSSSLPLPQHSHARSPAVTLAQLQASQHTAFPTTFDAVLSGKKFSFESQIVEVRALQFSSNKRPISRTPRDAQ